MLVTPATVASTLAGLLLTQAAPPTDRVLNCTTSGCHSEQMSHQVLHGPVAAGFCSACHEYTEPTTHEFQLKRQGASLCSFCHVGKMNLTGMVVHPPVADEQCTDCHNPHGGNRQYMLSGATNRELCTSCHEQILVAEGSVHSPILRDDDCLQCHLAHTSLHDRLLKEEPTTLCRSCHASVFEPVDLAREQMSFLATGLSIDPTSANGASSVTGGPYVHQPLLDGMCDQCHEVHASTHPTLLKQEPATLCTGCHEPVKLAALNAVATHTPMMDDRACLNCHNPHHGDHATLLRDEPLTTCLQCHHDTAVARPDDTIVPSLAPLLDPNIKLHAPVAEGNCRGCHNVHGAEHAKLLNEPFPTEFYHRFKRDDYETCFSCHEAELATEALTATATNFRNGEQNLHNIHVVAKGDDGRSCRVCHDVHGSTRDALTHASVPFGEWEIPIQFSRSDTGGSCAAGCHRARRYDRLVPVDNSPPVPLP
jgi:predicted CXXCH cytochrome family protein